MRGEGFPAGTSAGGLSLSCGSSRGGFSLFSCVDPKKFSSQDSDTCKKCPTCRWLCEGSNEITFLSSTSKTSVLEGGCWDTLGDPILPCAPCFFPCRASAASTNGRHGGRAQPARGRWACAQLLCPTGLAEFQVGAQTLAYGPGNSYAKTKLLSTVAPFLILPGGARA